MMLIRPRTHASRNFGGELPDRECGAVDRERRDDRVDTRSVGETRVHHRTRLVHSAADLGDDLVDRATELPLVVELGPGPVQLARTLHVDRVPVVHHDLGDLRVADVGLERSKTEDAVTDLANDEELLLRGERSLFFVEELSQALVDHALELGVGKGRVVQAGTEAFDQALLHPSSDLGDPVLLLGLLQPVCQGHRVPPLPFHR
jgi:hypothetical protein